MSTHVRVFVLLLFAARTLPALPLPQQQAPAAGPCKVVLNVVVTPKSGRPVGGLKERDFTILDNKAPQTITSFSAVDGGQAPVEVVVVIDAVNIGYENVALQRLAAKSFCGSLRAGRYSAAPAPGSSGSELARAPRGPSVSALSQIRRALN